MVRPSRGPHAAYVDGWLSLGLGEIAQELARRPPAAPPAKEPEHEAPGSISFEPDPTAELINLAQEYSPEYVNGMRIQARRGDPRMLFALYDEMKRFGPGPFREKWREKQAESILTITAPAKPAKGKKGQGTDAAAEDAANYLDALFRPHLRTLWSLNATRHEYGIAAALVAWDPGAAEGGRDLISELKEIPPRHFRWDKPTKQWLFLPDAKKFDGIPVKTLVEMGLLLFWELEPGAHIDQRGLCFQTIVPFFLSQKGWRWWARFTELVGIPPRIAKYKDPKDIPTLERMCQNGAAAGWAVIRDTSTFEFLSQATNSGQASGTHERFVRYAQEMYSLVYLGHGQGSSVEQGAGSVQSSAKASEDARAIVNGRLSFLAADLKVFGAAALARNVKGVSKAPVAVEIAIAIPQPVNRKEEAEILKTAKDAGLGAAISTKAAVERIGHVYVEEEDREETETMGAPAPVPVLGAPGEKPALPPAKAEDEEADEEASKKKLAARVIGDPHRFVARGEGAPPDVSAPAGIGEEIAAPFRQIIEQGIRDEARPTEILARIQHRMRGNVLAPELEDRLASALMDGLMRGVESVREARA